MTYETFSEELLLLLTNHFPADTSLSTQPVLKNNNHVLHGLLITDDSVNISPTIYLEPYYDLYETGVSMEDIAAQIISCYESHRIDENIDISFFEDFEQVKSQIIYKLINAEQNKELLADLPHIPYLDLAIVFCCFVPGDTCHFVDDNTNGTILVHNNHMDMWQTNEAELLGLAMANTPRILTPQFMPLYDVMEELMPQEFDEPELSSMIPIYILSNAFRFLGASALLYRGLMEECAKKLGSDFYIIPSSIHEVLLLPKDCGSNSSDIDGMIRDVNENHVSPEEILSDHVYYYSTEKKAICY